jgi:hypothetical protein
VEGERDGGREGEGEGELKVPVANPGGPWLPSHHLPGMLRNSSPSSFTFSAEPAQAAAAGVKEEEDREEEEEEEEEGIEEGMVEEDARVLDSSWRARSAA